jgi:hypothetical protein
VAFRSRTFGRHILNRRRSISSVTTSDLVGAISFNPVQDLVSARNAIVHRCGRATDQFRRRVKKRRAVSVNAYLMSRPGPTATRATHFERLLMDFTVVSTDIYNRAFARPRK